MKLFYRAKRKSARILQYTHLKMIAEPTILLGNFCIFATLGKWRDTPEWHVFVSLAVRRGDVRPRSFDFERELRFCSRSSSAGRPGRSPLLPATTTGLRRPPRSIVPSSVRGDPDEDHVLVRPERAPRAVVVRERDARRRDLAAARAREGPPPPHRAATPSRRAQSTARRATIPSRRDRSADDGDPRPPSAARRAHEQDSRARETEARPAPRWLRPGSSKEEEAVPESDGRRWRPSEVPPYLGRRVSEQELARPLVVAAEDDVVAEEGHRASGGPAARHGA